MTAKKLSALVWREWRLTRKSYFTGLCACFFLLGFFWLIRLSMSVGNLAPIFAESELITEFGGILYHASVTLAAAILLSTGAMDNTVLIADMHANWLRYSFALPIPAKARVTVSYIIKLGKILIAVLLMIPVSIFTAKITGQVFTHHMVWFILAMAAATLAYDTLLQCFVSSARTVKQHNAALVKIYSILTLIMFIWAFFKFSKQSEEAPEIDRMIEKIQNAFITHENFIIPLTVILLIVLPVIGWLVSVRNYRQFGDAKKETEPEKGGLFSFKNKKKEGEDA